MEQKPTQRVILHMPRELVALLDDYRFGKRIDSRAEAIRELLEIALKSQDRKSKP